MDITTTEDIVGKRIVKTIGVVFGACVQTKHLGKDIGAGLRTIVGGESKGYTELLEESRRTATQRMVTSAESLGANAIICMRYTTSQTMPSAAELIAFGTAVVVEDSGASTGE